MFEHRVVQRAEVVHQPESRPARPLFFLGAYMKPSQYYMHKRAMDVCIFVERSYRISDNRFSVRASFWNLGYSGVPWLSDVERRYDIADSNDWVNITDKFLDKRTAAGLP